MIHPAGESAQPSLIASEIKHKAVPCEPAFNTWDILKKDQVKPKRSGLMRNSDSLHVALRPVITLAQCFALFPVNGINAPDASGLSFTWGSFKILYCALTLIMSAFMTVTSVIRIISTKFHSTKITTLVFSVTSCLTSLMFLKLARKWPKFAKSWEKIEGELTIRYNQPSKYSLVRRFKIVTIIIVTLAFFEHALSLASGYISARECASLLGDNDVAAIYFKTQFPQVFNKTNYALWKGIVVQCTNVLSTFSWNFMDLFLILLSTALTYHFNLLNKRLNNVKNKTMPEWWWAEARSDYNNLASLTRQVDSYVADIVLLSFGTDLYFICIQLMYSFDRMTSVMRTIYLSFSFGFLLGRTTAVSLTAASVHDESLLPAPVLYGVNGSSYSTEVIRFLTQVTTDNIGLTGMKFFSITRSFVLTVAGTIVTYELVLIQFNNVQQVSHLNLTNVCEYRMESN
ncbi:gustatory receptor for sugar taste 64e-like [Microplitis mediator]|uniref:gustatory receptor for sugar taste 64e-like n=1 Tax=Microplitis mediator TaxID=375433 RepID=UPI002552D426|nr:gustatory receptor for sugar taste 64e-like [Microplitis mediator]XP_057327278.1 gustatory receptor for sugar taste 64e-like [Microplitis mediator]XP_057327279.1 gustatory receptor for sugar taste 64e-like [Microplitis mediator]